MCIEGLSWLDSRAPAIGTAETGFIGRMSTCVADVALQQDCWQKAGSVADREQLGWTSSGVLANHSDCCSRLQKVNHVVAWPYGGPGRVVEGIRLYGRLCFDSEAFRHDATNSLIRRHKERTHLSG